MKDIIGRMMDAEQGELPDVELIILLRDLYNIGAIDKLPGTWGRAFAQVVRDGLIAVDEFDRAYETFIVSVVQDLDVIGEYDDREEDREEDKEEDKETNE